MKTPPLKLLAIDDDPYALAILNAVVADVLPGATLSTATNGSDGIGLARADDPDVILLDIAMPGADGLAVCRELKADPHLRTIPVVFLTGLDQDRKLRLKALEVGAEGFMTKPPDPAELVAHVTAMAKIRAAIRAQANEEARLARLVAERTAELGHQVLALERVQAMLQRRDFQHQAILRSSLNGFVLLDLAGRVLEVNETYCAMSGYDASELLTMQISQLDASERADDVAARIQGIRARGSDRFETQLLCKNGTTCEIEVSVQLSDVDGGQLICFVQDISERMGAQNRLEAQFALLNALINSPDDIVIFSLDRNYRYTAFNEKHRQEMRAVWQAEIALGTSLLDCMTDDRLRALARASLDRALSGEAFTEVQHQPGPDVFYEFAWNPIRHPSGKVEGITAFIRDITAKRRDDARLAESERLLRESQEVAELGTYVLDTTTGLWTASPTLMAVFGIDASYSCTVEGWEALLHPDDRAMMSAHLKEDVLGRGAPFSKEYRIVRQNDGAERWVNGLGRLRRDADGRPVQMVGTIQDITARKVAELELRRRAEDLRDRNEELTLFNRLAVGRELRMIELKAEVNALCAQLREPLRYDLEALLGQDDDPAVTGPASAVSSDA